MRVTSILLVGRNRMPPDSVLGAAAARRGRITRCYAFFSPPIPAVISSLKLRMKQSIQHLHEGIVCMRPIITLPCSSSGRIFLVPAAPGSLRLTSSHQEPFSVLSVKQRLAFCGSTPSQVAMHLRICVLIEEKKKVYSVASLVVTPT